MSVQVPLQDSNLLEYLRNSGVLGPAEEARVEPVGDGNINWVRRVRSARGSRVVKQARPALERFPEYTVSTERIVFEARFYETVAPFDRGGLCPAVLAFDREQRVLVLEDLGEVERLDAALARGAELSSAGSALGGFLGAVHAGTRNRLPPERFDNQEMRRLHGDHIFHLPYRPNEFPLPPAVAEQARDIWKDRELVDIIDAAYARYLAPGEVLLHGDVQPANVLLTESGPRLLDAEIAHLGDPAFDLGQLLGHLLLPAAARGRAEDAASALDAAWRAYEAAGDAPPALAEALRYAGIELLRRSIGAARVPVLEDDTACLAVIALGKRLTLRPPERLETLLPD